MKKKEKVERSVGGRVRTLLKRLGEAEGETRKTAAMRRKHRSYASFMSTEN